MGFFDKIKDVAGNAGDAISKGARNASDSTKKMVEKNKLKSQISGLERDIEKKYTEIGKQYFKINSANPSPEFAEMIDFITSSQAKINELQKEIASIDNKYLCPVCGEGIAENAKFCPSCGSKFEKPDESPAPAKTLCPNCNAEVEPDAKFCTACGASFNKDENKESFSGNDVEIL